MKIASAALALALLLAPTARAETPVEGPSFLPEWPQQTGNFGESVALLPGYAFVLAPGEDISQGILYVYREIGGVWSQSQRVAITSYGDRASIVAAIPGRVVLGAPNHNGVIEYSGAVYVLELQGTDWVQTARIDPPVEQLHGQFGYAVDLQGDRIVVGSRSFNNGPTSSGQAYVFALQGAAWTLEATLSANDPLMNDRFGASVAIDGDTIVVGAIAGTVNGTRGGSAYVFRNVAGTWQMEAEVGASDETPEDRFGWSVDLEGDRIAVGAFSAGPSDSEERGAVYVYERSSSTWSQTEKITAPGVTYTHNFSRFGFYVLLRGDQLFVGHPEMPDQIGNSSLQDYGTVWVFAKEATGWPVQHRILPLDLPSLPDFGASCAVDGNRVLVGAPRNSDGGFPVASGKAWLFELPANLSSVCAGDGILSPCPCGNNSATALGRGCRWSTGMAGRLVARGSASVGADSLVLYAGQTSSSSVLFFQGSSLIGGGQGSSFGDGLRCAGGSTRRLGTITAVNTISEMPNPGQPTPLSISGSNAPGDVRVYQAWYRNSSTFCTAATFNLTNAIRVEWQP